MLTDTHKLVASPTYLLTNAQGLVVRGMGGGLDVWGLGYGFGGFSVWGSGGLGFLVRGVG